MQVHTKVEDLFRFGRHQNIQVIYLAHYAKDVFPIARGNCFKIFIRNNNPNNFFETIIQTYSIKDPGGDAACALLLKWKQNRDQLEFGIIEFDTGSQKYKKLNHKDNLLIVINTLLVGPSFSGKPPFLLNKVQLVRLDDPLR